jgi:hypothetical protein
LFSFSACCSLSDSILAALFQFQVYDSVLNMKLLC